MARRETFKVPLRIVFYKEGDSWIAHCLEFDLIGDGHTETDALSNLCDAIVIQVEASMQHGNPANLFAPADGKYLAMFAAGHKNTIGMLKIVEIVERLKSSSPVIDGVETRRYEDSESDLALA